MSGPVVAPEPGTIAGGKLAAPCDAAEAATAFGFSAPTASDPESAKLVAKLGAATSTGTESSLLAEAGTGTGTGSIATVDVFCGALATSVRRLNGKKISTAIPSSNTSTARTKGLES